jgi:hypothetical protein
MIMIQMLKAEAPSNFVSRAKLLITTELLVASH